ncbi:MAG: beta-galactosidase [Bacteroidales bacterium]|jgi:beta-galactosidase|nr:beta-galactosidase [Bacteroidales bacterium]
MKFSVRDNNFYIDDRKVFLSSGEIHYFRIRRELWDRHLEEAVSAGLKAVSTYVPWAWHEEEEGVFDFDGNSCSEKDLNGWLRRCREHGLHAIVKPGPFILAEFRGAGLPDWFLEKYGEAVRMRTRRGKKVMSDGVSLFNSHYLDKVRLWYDQVMPVIRNHELQAGGPVIMMQVCNEIGVFSWLARQADYGNEVRKMFISWVTAKYGNVSEVNRLWGTAYSSLDNIELPPDGGEPYSSPADRGLDNAWHSFWRHYYGDYLRMLSSMIRERGVTVPIYHNLPGWIYGSGYEFPVNITMYEDLFRGRSEIIFGVDHIPEFVSYRNLHDDRIINDITLAMQGHGPLFAAEFQSGSREYHVVTNPREMELFYKASIANGLKGWNFYMFSQGRNVSRRGYSGDTFYWFTPLDAEGRRGTTWPVVEKMGRMTEVSGDIIVNASRRAEVCVLFYPHWYATELERPAGEAAGLTYVPSAVRRPAYFDGLLKALQVLNVDYDMADLSSASPESLSGYRQLFVFATDEMDAQAQKTVADYITVGGHAVIYPFLPDRETSQQPCTILRDTIGVVPSGSEVIDSPLIDMFDLHDIKCSNPQIVFAPQTLAGAEVVARTIRGTPCGFRKNVGKGIVTFIGTWAGFDTEAHRAFYEKLLESPGTRLRNATSDNGYIIVRERFTDDGRALLFVANYYNEEMSGMITYKHPVTGESVNMPLGGGEILFPPLRAILTPVCLQLAEGVTMLHSTSDLLGCRKKGNEIILTLCGDRDLPGEIVLEGPQKGSISSAEITGMPAEIKLIRGRKVINYTHVHGKEMMLKFTLDQAVSGNC